MQPTATQTCFWRYSLSAVLANIHLQNTCVFEKGMQLFIDTLKLSFHRAPLGHLLHPVSNDICLQKLMEMRFMGAR